MMSSKYFESFFPFPSQYERNAVLVYMGTVNDATAISTFWLENTIDSEVFVNCFMNQPQNLLFYWNEACTKVEDMLRAFRG